MKELLRYDEFLSYQLCSNRGTEIPDIQTTLSRGKCLAATQLRERLWEISFCLEDYDETSCNIIKEWFKSMQVQSYYQCLKTLREATYTTGVRSGSQRLGAH